MKPVITMGIVVVAVIAVGAGAYLLLKPTTESTTNGNWIKDDGIRVSEGVSSCTLLLPDNTYRMYYTGMGGILSAISSDGLNWTKENGTRVQPGTNSVVIRFENGSYRMIYNEQQGQAPNARLWFVSAFSTDGITWIKEPGTRLDSEEAPDYGAISVPDIVRLQDGRYRMYYVGDMFNNGVAEKGNSIRSAVSSDNGLTWEKENITGIPAQCMDPDVIILADGTFRLFYTASPPGKFPGNLHVYSAVSPDGLNWTKEDGVRVALGGSYDLLMCMDPDVVKLSDGTYRMYYSGLSEEPEGVTHILSAKSP